MISRRTLGGYGSIAPNDAPNEQPPGYGGGPQRRRLPGAGGPPPQRQGPVGASPMAVPPSQPVTDDMGATMNPGNMGAYMGEQQNEEGISRFLRMLMGVGV